MIKKVPFLFVLIFVVSLITKSSVAQNRINTHNTIVWLNQFHTININKQWAVLAEYQWRRVDGLKSWQQSLLRGGIQYKFKNGLNVLAGYAWTETFPYGEYPPAASQPVPEHRIYQQVMWNGNIGRLMLNHRGRLEQRFVGVLNPAATGEREVTKWLYLNRLRYQLRAVMPLNHATMLDKTFYAAAFDEIFIGFGKNVNVNVFDQNRVGLAAGYKLNSRFSFDFVVFNQTVQQANLVGGKSVYQNNNGFMVNANFNWN